MIAIFKRFRLSFIYNTSVIYVLSFNTLAKAVAESLTTSSILIIIGGNAGEIMRISSEYLAVINRSLELKLIHDEGHSRVSESYGVTQ